LNTKTCSSCNVEKPVSEFNKCTEKSDGLHSNCKDCRKAQRTKNRDRLAAQHKAHYEANKASVAKRQKKYRSANRDAINAQQKAYRAEHREALNERRRKRLRESPTIWANKAWHRLNQRTVNGSHPRWQDARHAIYLRKGVELRITEEELRAIVEANWPRMQAMYDAGEKPSVDRVDPEGHYEPSNIRIITARQNAKRIHDLRNAGHQITSTRTPGGIWRYELKEL
jgi:hypothetical protein